MSTIKPIPRHTRAGAIRGRRNRCHELQAVIRYNPFDQPARQEIEDKLKKHLGDARYIIMPNTCDITFPARKKPRILSRDEWDFLKGLVMGLQARVDRLQKQLDDFENGRTQIFLHGPSKFRE